MPDQKLLPCPFCGAEAEIERRGDRRVSTIYSCTECGCMLETGEEWGHGERWNRRATPPGDNKVRKALEAAQGYLRNAKIDLETGAPKRTAIQTLEGGLRLVDAALYDGDKNNAK